jgi:hypothetical protein
MSASDRPLGDLLEEIEDGKLIVRPGFQRRLVWTNKDKEYFIDTVLRGLPFPEIFVCTGERDAARSTRNKWLVDGQQRMTTLRDYAAGSKDLLYKTVPRFANLTTEQKEKFLETNVAVRDLQRVTPSQLKEIFTRINSTNYVLKSMEKRNALFSGAMKLYCDALSEQPFFKTHNVFSEGRRKRMEDLAFSVILVSTILGGYFNRDAKNAEFLERYNDDFPDQEKIQFELDVVFSKIEECDLAKSPEAWKPTNLFTLIVELHHAIHEKKLLVDANKLKDELFTFYAYVHALQKSKPAMPTDENSDDVFNYWKASRTAANDKHSRIRRAEIISNLIKKATLESAPSVESQVDVTKKSAKRTNKST